MIFSDKVNNVTGRNILSNEGLDSLNFEVKVNTYCPLGKNITEKTINTDLRFGKYIPDLLDIEDLIKDINNSSLINEDLLLKWMDYFMIYEPEEINVTVSSNAHFPLKLKGHYKKGDK